MFFCLKLHMERETEREKMDTRQMTERSCEKGREREVVNGGERERNIENERTREKREK